MISNPKDLVDDTFLKLNSTFKEIFLKPGNAPGSKPDEIIGNTVPDQGETPEISLRSA